jgi:hypothetical protein
MSRVANNPVFELIGQLALSAGTLPGIGMDCDEAWAEEGWAAN